MVCFSGRTVISIGSTTGDSASVDTAEVVSVGALVSVGSFSVVSIATDAVVSGVCGSAAVVVTEGTSVPAVVTLAGKSSEV